MIRASFLFLIPVFCLVLSKEIKFEPCGGQVKSVSVEPCSTEPCEIPKGASAFINVHCLSNTKAEKLRLSVWADVAGIELPYPGMKRDACKGKNITCPSLKIRTCTMFRNLRSRNSSPRSRPSPL
ncbi:NPC intracellular cholesterol transporter 2 [Trichonephila inaurata madagascariensis]|uniref:NPC intracellular cholesterol transporter 2 n=1 Tax=Trichonephila inaurata madagascariensis TaxID=2747483 RepID=A0A8X6WRM7_9ARAC|nr:NPC intracellular cholesterol transporter 2 [Trichonephila inaurata madagascariensis]